MVLAESSAFIQQPITLEKIFDGANEHSLILSNGEFSF
jgi:hypothetical protein